MSDEETVTGDRSSAPNIDIPAVNNAPAVNNLPVAINEAGPSRSPIPVSIPRANNSADKMPPPATDALILTSLTPRPLSAQTAADAGANAVDLENDPANAKISQGATKRGRKGKAKAVEAPLVDAAGVLMEPRNPTRRSARRV